VKKNVIVDKKRLQKIKDRAVKARGLGQKFVFDEEGNAKSLYELQSFDEFIREKPLQDRQHEYFEKTGALMKKEDLLDKKRQKDLQQTKKKERKRKEKLVRQEAEGNSVGVTLGGGSENDEDEEPEFDEPEFENDFEKEVEDFDYPLKSSKRHRPDDANEDLEDFALALLSHD
ncbi:hypothetical protein HK096_006727, partial [Nowakowskiella sp. JEL0078]